MYVLTQVLICCKNGTIEILSPLIFLFNVPPCSIPLPKIKISALSLIPTTKVIIKYGQFLLRILPQIIVLCLILAAPPLVSASIIYLLDYSCRLLNLLSFVLSP